jgi:hypothetical protein
MVVRAPMARVTRVDRCMMFGEAGRQLNVVAESMRGLGDNVRASVRQ